MTRIPTVTREELPAAQRAIYDRIAESRGRVSGPFAVLLNSPEVADRAAHLGAYLRFDSKLPPTVRELATLTTAREYDCQYEWASHFPMAREAGVRAEATEAVRTKKAPAGLTPDEALIVRYVQELVRKHRVTDKTFKEALAKFGRQGITELTATIGYYGMLACPLNAFEVPAGETTSPPLVE